ncbi:MAG: cell envelope biogenesis protein LolA [Fluviicola sp.]|nr:MAG: cell envelope biogenesis protein LolA [Fluviicola sp.]
MMKYITILIISFQFIAFSQETELSSSEATKFRAMVEKGTKDLKSIKTDFVQNKHMEFLTNDIESKGKMYLSAEGMLRWQYTEPNKYSIIFKNEKIYIDDNGKKSTVDGDQKMFQKISKLISGSVKGDLFDDDEFDIRYFKKGDNILVKLTPKNKAMTKYISKVVLTFPKNDSTVSQVKLIEPSGDYTLITFKNKQLNVPIDKSVFSH